MTELIGTVVAGPVDKVSGLPQYVDVFGQRSVGGRGHWVFREASPKRTPRLPGTPDPGPDPIYRLRRGWGVNEAGCIMVGLALGLARHSGGVEATGRGLLRRSGVDVTKDILISPELVKACRPLYDVPLAVLITAPERDELFLAELAATGWSVSYAQLPTLVRR